MGQRTFERDSGGSWFIGRRVGKPPQNARAYPPASALSITPISPGAKREEVKL